MRVSECVCVCERERERGGEGGRVLWGWGGVCVHTLLFELMSKHEYANVPHMCVAL